MSISGAVCLAAGICGIWLVVDEVVNSLALAAEIFFCLRWTLLDSETGVGTELVTGEMFAEFFTRGPVRADESGSNSFPASGVA